MKTITRQGQPDQQTLAEIEATMAKSRVTPQGLQGRLEGLLPFKKHRIPARPEYLEKNWIEAWFIPGLILLNVIAIVAFYALIPILMYPAMNY